MTRIQELSLRITSCDACPRLREWCQEVAQVKKAKYQDDTYWGRPVPGFGDPKARLIILGLAPGAHGANRTGRVFTGDESGKWLYGALHHFGFATEPEALHRTDSLQLVDAYINNIVRCAPPQNKPTAGEIQNCRPFFTEELRLLTEKKVVLALGKIAFDNYKKFMQEEGYDVKGLTFAHGACYTFDDGRPHLVASYHPSQQNTFTGKLTKAMWYGIFQIICQLLDPTDV
ncbi:uracil-DNA glycosylase [Tumebacillus algifaecis]|uniref:Type-5 uracil-DNA glycosylase n=1 Tax=Tumebacillus algifaecis TaxID=1214604 RepID=A0A223D4L5_9BACL|nr:uracil-DNA glycosylase [Tumebacillus algifaecis]ASS76511.1 uracil-DNA glycosylase [Tumebacillus algifaecis]